MSTPVHIDYATPTARDHTFLLHRLSIIFSAAPLVVGIGCVLLYWLTRNEAFTFIGFFTLGGGFISICIATILLAIYWGSFRNHPAIDRSSFNRRVLAAALLIASNFPIAAACAGAGIYLSSQVPISITVTNNSSQTATHINLQAKHNSISIANLPPGASVSRTRYANTTSLTCSLTLPDKTVLHASTHVGDPDSAKQSCTFTLHPDRTLNAR